MTDKFTIFNMGLNGSFIKENGKIMEIEKVVDLLNKGDHLKQSHKEILRDLEVTTFDKELLQKEKEGLYKENKQLKMYMKSVKAHLEGGKEDMTEKYCNRDCIHFESDYHWYGNEEWEEVNCELGHSEIHDTAYFPYCEDYDDGGKYDD